MRHNGVQVAHLAEAALRHAIPFRKALRRLKRRLQPYDDNASNSHYCITNGLEQIVALRRAGFDVRGKSVLEFGTGWLPLIPLLFHLAGAARLTLTDIDRLMDDQTIARARAIVRGRMDDIAAALGQPRDALLARLDVPMAYEYLVPWDAAAHPAGSMDLVISRATFEHVPEAQIAFFLRQFHRILRPGGMTTHLVDNSDHWQHRDPALSRINFLRFEDGDPVWKLGQFNPQAFQNRLRHDDYIRLLEDAGFELRAALGEPDPKCLADLATLPLAARFRGRPPRDLAVLISLFVAQKPA
ncbi:class I SAM-dependent methyltransferase [Falsiroseomonas sp. HC035]|uniref:class I SAM-dependent methyltransferase n=1 Tax=Falsiroseomonas sp. HC035 TaxID=3390999 RepID=UPI003D31DF09